MSFITGKHLPRRTFLRGVGATVALPFLDAMVPAGRLLAQAPPAERTRLVCIEEVHGLAGCNDWGATQVPLRAGDGRHATSTLVADNPLKPLEPYRDYLTIISNTDVRMAEAFDAAGDRRRPLPLERGVPHAVASRSRRRARTSTCGTSLDQLYAQRFGQDTPMPSMQLCIENLDQAGGCTYNYSCAYTDSISWASPNEPLPMIRDPRVAFDMLFGAGGDAPRSRGAARRPAAASSTGSPARSPTSASELGAADRDAARPVPRERPRDRAPHPGGRGAQHERRGARAARRAGRRARLVRRAHAS